MSRFKLVVRGDAKDEAEAIRAWYEKPRTGLGDRCVDALDACLDELILDPFLQVRK